MDGWKGGRMDENLKASPSLLLLGWLPRKAGGFESDSSSTRRDLERRLHCTPGPVDARCWVLRLPIPICEGQIVGWCTYPNGEDVGIFGQQRRTGKEGPGYQAWRPGYQGNELTTITRVNSDTSRFVTHCYYYTNQRSIKTNLLKQRVLLFHGWQNHNNKRNVDNPEVSLYTLRKTNLMIRHLCFFCLKCGSGKRKNIFFSCKTTKVSSYLNRPRSGNCAN